MRRRTKVLLGLAATTAAVEVVRHGRGTLIGRHRPQGILIGDTGLYEALSRLVLGPFFVGVAADVAAAAQPGARVLEIGCGPGHLALALAREHGLDVTALDVDPAMIRRAESNAARTAGAHPTFVCGDVTSLAFLDETFDLVASTLSMHHWPDATAGLTEIRRVLRPGGIALVWDLGPGFGPLHEHLPDPVERAQGSPLEITDVRPWPWPWRWHLTTRIELVRPSGSAGPPGPSRPEP